MRRAGEIFGLTVAKSEVYKPLYQPAQGKNLQPLKDGLFGASYVIALAPCRSLSSRGTFMRSHAIHVAGSRTSQLFEFCARV